LEGAGTAALAALPFAAAGLTTFSSLLLSLSEDDSAGLAAFDAAVPAAGFAVVLLTGAALVGASSSELESLSLAAAGLALATGAGLVGAGTVAYQARAAAG